MSNLNSTTIETASILDNNNNNNSSLNLLNRYTWTTLFLEFAPASIYFDRYVSIVWFCLGFFGNSLSMVVWMTPKIRRENSSAIYLAALALADSCLLLLMIVRDLVYAWNTPVLRDPVLCKFYYILYLTFQYTSPVLVLAFTVERWIAICYPFQRDRLCTPRRAAFVVVFLGLTCLSLCLPQGYFWFYDPMKQACRANIEPHLKLLWDVYTWSLEALISAFVPVSTLVFNVLVIREFHKITSNSSALARLRARHQQEREPSSNFRSTTVMLLSVSFFLIFTTFPAGVVYALQNNMVSPGNIHMTDAQIRRDATWQYYFLMMSFKAAIDELALSHFACNFIIYLATGRMYRAQVGRLLRLNCLVGPGEQSNYSPLSSRTIGRSDSRCFTGGSLLIVNGGGQSGAVGSVSLSMHRTNTSDFRIAEPLVESNGRFCCPRNNRRKKAESGGGGKTPMPRQSQSNMITNV